MIAMYDSWWFGPCISSNIYRNVIILVSPHWQFSNLNIHTSQALKIFLKSFFMRFDYTPGYASLQGEGVGKC